MKKDMYNFITYKGHTIGEIQNDSLGIVIYFMDVDQLNIEESIWKESIPADRFEKMKKYRRNVDKQLLVGNEILFEYGIQKVRPDIEPSEFVRGVDAAGKPYLLNVEDVYFNMSHSGCYAVCGFAERPLGVDVEKVQELDLSIAEAYFTKKEYDDIIGRDTREKKLDRFFDYWVLKESFLKSIGLGLSVQLNSFEFIESGEVIGVQQSIDEKEYVSHQIYFGECYKMAVCMASS